MSRRSRENHIVGFHNTDSTKTARWRTIMDLDFKSMFTAGALSENQGTFTTLDGYKYHARCGNTGSFSATMTDDTGLVVDFAQTNTQNHRVGWLVENYERLADGSFPRFRVTASFSGLVFSHNSDYVGVGLMSYDGNNANPYTPGVYIKYDCTDSSADPVTKKYGSVTCSGWGGHSSASQNATTIASNNAASGVLCVEDAGQGCWKTYGDDNTVALKGGQQLHTYRNTMLVPYSTTKLNNSSVHWAESNGSRGPVAVLLGKNGSNGSQAVTWERLVVEAYY
jgi:hypothetical protein